MTSLEFDAIIIKLNQANQYSGVSPSGKAADSDSVISRVQILPPQPVKLTQLREFFVYVTEHKNDTKHFLINLSDI